MRECGNAGSGIGGRGIVAPNPASVPQESQSMPWNSREEIAAQPGRRARSRNGLEVPERVPELPGNGIGDGDGMGWDWGWG